MEKQIESTTGSSLVAYLFAAVFGIAGLIIIGWQWCELEGGFSQQFGLALLLGGGFLVISFFVARTSLKQAQKIAWLRENGIWITAKPVDFRTVTTDESERLTSFCLILRAAESSQSIVKQTNLKDLKFESDPIYSRFLFDDYQEKEYDIVIDPTAPEDRYHVNVNSRMFNSVT